MEYKNNDRIRSIKALCDYQSGLLQSILIRINNLEKNTLSRKPPLPPPPDSFFRKPSESSPRK